MLIYITYVNVRERKSIRVCSPTPTVYQLSCVNSIESFIRVGQGQNKLITRRMHTVLTRQHSAIGSS